MEVTSSQSTRKGDARITRVPYIPDQESGWEAEVYIHNDRGVTILVRDHRGEERARMSFTRETWAAIVEASQ